MKLLIDMSLSPLWVQFLGESGIEGVHWSHVGSPSAPDSEIMDHAAAEGFVVFPHDLDFGTLLAHRSSGQPSVVQIRTQDVLPHAAGEATVRALLSFRSQLEMVRS
jgi:predicted nuclease of predicted toxin-antitoxin system